MIRLYEKITAVQLSIFEQLFLCCKKLYKYNEINNIFPRDKYIMIKNIKNEQLEIKRLCDEIWKLSLEQGVPITPLSEVKESTWITTLSEHLYDEGMFNIETPNEYKQGDIVMVNTFFDAATNKPFKEGRHRILVITDSGNSNAKDREYYGYMLSSKAEKALLKNYNNKNYHYIGSYNSIVNAEKWKLNDDISILLRLDHLYAFHRSGVSGQGLKGRVKEQFIKYINYLMVNKNNPDVMSWEEFDK